MKVVFCVGPTASGKSALALDLAKKFDGHLLNADSVQLYDGLLIGSAAPTEFEKSQVPHHLFSQVQAPAVWTAGDFARAAHECLSALAKQDVKVVFVVGGTGFYLRALEKGMLPISKADPAEQALIESELSEVGGPARLHQELLSLDPLLKNRIYLNDHYRIARALEIMRRERRPLTEIEKEHQALEKPFAYPLLKLGLQVEREVLRARLHKRTAQMIEAGLLGEVTGLLQKGLGEWDPLRSVGYVETVEFLSGSSEIPDVQALHEKIVQNSMRLAKRQKTWFQRDLDIAWGNFEDWDFFEAKLGQFLKFAT